jgi:hypothetical protein
MSARTRLASLAFAATWLSVLALIELVLSVGA